MIHIFQDYYFVVEASEVTIIKIHILDKAICISLCANALENSINLSFFLPSYGWLVGQTGFISLDKATSLREGKTLKLN